MRRKGRYSSSYVAGDVGAFNENEKEGVYNNVSMAVNLRHTYQWIPSEVQVTKEGRVRFVSDIHNLPNNPANKELYSLITRVFEAMVPMFAKLHLIRSGEDTRLQVIVKVNPKASEFFRLRVTTCCLV